jgi:hypothetical protein
MTAIIIWILFGAVCYFLAKEKNRDTTVAAIMGCLFGVFALIYYLVVDKKS